MCLHLPPDWMHNLKGLLDSYWNYLISALQANAELPIHQRLLSNGGILSAVELDKLDSIFARFPLTMDMKAGRFPYHPSHFKSFKGI